MTVRCESRMYVAHKPGINRSTYGFFDRLRTSEDFDDLGHLKWSELLSMKDNRCF